MVRRLTAIAWALGSLIGPAVAHAHIVRVDYAGTLTNSYHSVGQNGSLDINQSLTWDETEYFDTKSSSAQRTLSAQGVVHTHYGGGSDKNCPLSSSGDPSQIPIMVNLGDKAGEVHVEASMPVNAGPGGPLKTNGDPNCGTVDYGDETGAQTTGDPCIGGFAASPAFANPEVAKSVPSTGYTKKYDGQETLPIQPGTFACRNETEDTETRTIHASLKVGDGGPETPSPTGPTLKERRQVFAAADLLATLLRAEQPCGYVALGGLTAVWGSTVPGASSAAALVPAEFLIAAGEPLCVQYMIRAYQDISIYNDPPAGDIHAIARPMLSRRAAPKLPSCRKQPKRLRGYCADVRDGVADLIVAARKTTALAVALRKTVFRETKAKQAGDAAALKAQTASGDKLTREIKAADATERRVGARLRKAIKQKSVEGQFTARQDATAIAEITKRLEARGVSEATLAKLGSGALEADRYDLLKHLSSG